MKEDSVLNLKGVGKKTGALLQKLGIVTQWDLIIHFPARYEEWPPPMKIEKWQPEGRAVIGGELAGSIRTSIAGNYKISAGKITDYQNTIPVYWFNSPYVGAVLKQNTPYIFDGKLTRKRNVLSLEHPRIFSREEYQEKMGSLSPVYALTKGLGNGSLSKAVAQALQGCRSQIREYLPKKLMQKFSLEDLTQALENIHFPENRERLQKARQRLSFDDFFLFLYYMRRAKRENTGRISPCPICMDKEYLDQIYKALPFALTPSQKKALEEILGDLEGGGVMNRLLQGDVGSGKTVVALLAALLCIRQGYQVSVMVPTEVLARQHYENMAKLTASLPCPPSLALLTGSLRKKERERELERIGLGEADLVIGTHALIQEKVAFYNLGLVITDEQHRFGVRQRQELQQKGQTPHVLVMSATPIPRTLAVILYGDLDISSMEGKPGGRLPIKNAVISAGDRRKAYGHILKEIEAGHQAMVICPMVEESENIEAENVLDYSKKLRAFFSEKNKTKKINIEVLHGRMKQREKDDIMNRYAGGSIDILVSTTVIEVGIDVPNATVVMIEDAQRFGLASLHQLRGRVGRSRLQSYAVFVRTSDASAAKKRLEVVGTSNDGFYIAAEDLKLRGPGELFGLAQSGELEFGLGEPYRDTEAFEMAREAVDWLEGAVLRPQEGEVLEKRMLEYGKQQYANIVL